MNNTIIAISLKDSREIFFNKFGKSYSIVTGHVWTLSNAF